MGQTAPSSKKEENGTGTGTEKGGSTEEGIEAGHFSTAGRVQENQNKDKHPHTEQGNRTNSSHVGTMEGNRNNDENEKGGTRET